ncbi:MAG TPA: folylpolyglutamate synthase/dihydrofolate synthase family protein [Desulfuromonadales bacterium]
MGYRESLDYLYGLQRFGIKLGLENIRTLLTRLGHPERDLGILHIGGSNGKGSVASTLAEILVQAGYRVGLYTSPHLHSFTERIRVNGAAIAEDEVARLVAEIRSVTEGVPATFFEFTTALALLHFHRRLVDFVVLEVGMGGRLDATNAVTPRLSVITPICRDHAEHLGGTLAAIAAEKGGIIKPGVPLVLGRQEPEALEVLLARAQQLAAPVLLCGRDFAPLPASGGFSYRGPGMELAELQPGLAGVHQHDNLSVALAAAGLLRGQGVDLPEAALRRGVAQVRWPGRLEWWDGGRQVLLDGAHNEGGAKVLAAYLATLGVDGIRWVVGLKGDKRPDDILGPLLPLVTALYCTVPAAESAVPPEELRRRGEAAGLAGSVHATPAAAVAAALADRRGGEIVLVAGSLFLVAAAREYLLNQESDRS